MAIFGLFKGKAGKAAVSKVAHAVEAAEAKLLKTKAKAVKGLGTAHPEGVHKVIQEKIAERAAQKGVSAATAADIDVNKFNSGTWNKVMKEKIAERAAQKGVSVATAAAQTSVPAPAAQLTESQKSSDLLSQIKEKFGQNVEDRPTLGEAMKQSWAEGRKAIERAQTPPQQGPLSK